MSGRLQQRTGIWGILGRDAAERAMLVVLLLACGLALSKNYADPDLWGHVTYGRELLRSGLHETNTYSYTAEYHRWINHENLSEILLSLGADTAGPRGLLIGKLLLGWVVLLLMLRAAHQSDAHRPAIYAALLLVAANLMHFWSIRPQVFSYVLFSLQTALLTWCFHEPVRAEQPASARRRWLWLLPLMYLVWGNTHGAFVAGYAILAVYCGGKAVQLWWRDGSAARTEVGRLAAVLCVTGAATLANPYGIELHAWLLQSLGSPRPEIIEWRSPEIIGVVWLPLWTMVALTGLSLCLSKRPRDVTQLVLLGIALWQAVEHRRHIPFFTILFGFWVVPHISSAMQRLGIFGRDAQPDSARGPALMRWTMPVALCLSALLVGKNMLGQLSTIPVKRSDYPVSAFQFMADSRLQGRLVVRFKWAQYAIAAFADNAENRRMRVAFDGRFRTCYPQEIVDMYFDYALGHDPVEARHRSPSSPPVDGSRLLEFAEPDLVLVDRNQPHTVRLMQEHCHGWVLLYQDELAQLWGRGDRYNDPDSMDYLHPSKRHVSNEPQSGYVSWPGLPGPSADLLTRR